MQLVQDHGQDNQCQEGEGDENGKYCAQSGNRMHISCIAGQCANHYTTWAPWCQHSTHTYVSMRSVQTITDAYKQICTLSIAGSVSYHLPVRAAVWVWFKHCVTLTCVIRHHTALKVRRTPAGLEGAAAPAFPSGMTSLPENQSHAKVGVISMLLLLFELFEIFGVQAYNINFGKRSKTLTPQASAVTRQILCGNTGFISAPVSKFEMQNQIQIIVLVSKMCYFHRTLKF